MPDCSAMLAREHMRYCAPTLASTCHVDGPVGRPAVCADFPSMGPLWLVAEGRVAIETCPLGRAPAGAPVDCCCWDKAQGPPRAIRTGAKAGPGPA